MKPQSHPLKFLIFLVFSVAFNGLLMADDPAGVKFFTGSLKKVEEKAAREGKLYFVEFVAAWCMPCREMDETTFKDPALANYIEGSYVASKIDVDDFDGVVYKNQYNIKVLPTFLVFNSSGKLLGRYEEAMSAAKMLPLLKNYDNAANRKKSGTETTTPTTPSAGGISRPPLKPEVPGASPATPSAKPAATAQPGGKGLFRFDVSKQASQGYSVQIGVYGDYENVLRESARFKELFKEVILVHIDKLNDKTVYRLLIGNFDSQKEADSLALKIKEKGLSGYVKDLAGLK